MPNDEAKLGLANYSEQNLRVIVHYVEGSYFGDSDVFADKYNLSTTGRDTTAISHQNTTLFAMNLSTLDKIKSDFYEVYREMKDIGI